MPTMNTVQEFYRLRFEYMGEDSEGKLVTKKEDDLVVAVNYTDAEALAFEMMEEMKQYNDSVKYEIVKAKVPELLFTNVFSVDKEYKENYVLYFFSEEEDDAALFAVNVKYTETGENGKEKSKKENIYVAASSAKEAYDFVFKYLSKVETRDWSIRDVKFDKASSVLVTEEMYKNDLYKSENAGLLQ